MKKQFNKILATADTLAQCEFVITQKQIISLKYIKFVFATQFKSSLIIRVLLENKFQ